MEGNAPFPIDQNLSFLNLRKFSRNITSRTRSRSFFHFTLTSRSQFPVIFLSLGLLEKSEWHFYFTLHFLGEVKDIFLHFSLLDCPKPTLAGHCRWMTMKEKKLKHGIGSYFFPPSGPVISLAHVAWLGRVTTLVFSGFSSSLFEKF